jgi:cyclin H
MTYHPKEMMPSALFLATKTENHYTSLRSFTAKLEKTTAEDVVAPEFLLTQGLRFTFDVRHPQRGLEGGFMELLATANGKGPFAPASESRSASQLQKAMLDIDAPEEGIAKARSPADLVVRIQNAHGKAKDVLKTSALLTDAYFLYTPSHIWLSSLFLVDEPLARFYLGMKIHHDHLKEKLLLVLKQCADLLQSSISAEPGKSEMSDLTRIDKKLYKCRNPEKIDLVTINKTQKRDGSGKGSDVLDEKIIKKRKLERENSMREAEEIFGPSLVKDK